MPVEIKVEATHDLERINRQLKRLGQSDLRKEMFRGINRSVRPLKQRAQEAARRELPKRGGLNEFVASSRFSSRTRATGRDPGVRIVASKSGHDLRSLDRGRLRHPLFGNRQFWFNQPVKAWWFEDSLQASAGVVRRELVIVLDEVARKIR